MTNWPTLYQPVDLPEPRRDPVPSPVRDKKAKVALYEGRFEREERIFVVGDWNGRLDPTFVHDELATPGEEHNPNGSDKWSTEIGMHDRPPDNDLPDELPADWLEQELAAFRLGVFPLREYEPAAAKDDDEARILKFPAPPQSIELTA